MREAEVTINGQSLTCAESMALRVAVTDFIVTMQLDLNVLGADRHGHALRAAYLDKAESILAKLIGDSK